MNQAASNIKQRIQAELDDVNNDMRCLRAQGAVLERLMRFAYAQEEKELEDLKNETN